MACPRNTDAADPDSSTDVSQFGRNRSIEEQLDKGNRRDEGIHVRVSTRKGMP
jgi:hypothetical protein